MKRESPHRRQSTDSLVGHSSLSTVPLRKRGRTLRSTALEQGYDFETPIVVQRQAPMVQTVLEGSAVAAHRDSCLDGEADLHFQRFHSCNALTMEVIVFAE